MNKQHVLFAIIFMTAASPLYAGTVTGKVNFTGTAPEPTPISMDADPVCAGLHAEAPMTEDVVLNADNTLKNVFVYVKEGLQGKTFETPKEPVQLNQKGCHYEPHVLGIQVGQPLEIINSDSTLHNVHGMPQNSKEFNLGMPIPGMKLKRTFDKAEILVKFKCDVHPWMSAFIGVVDHPYYSVTQDQGTFEIKGLPAGDYVIEAVHEKYGAQTQNVTVTEDGSQTVDFTFSA